MMCSLYRMVLDGTELMFAGDGVEALDVAAREPDVDLFIVDVNLPRMDGIQFIRRLRDELGRRDTPVLVVSTECDEADQGEAYDAGATGYLCKPWTPDELRAAIQGLKEEGS